MRLRARVEVRLMTVGIRGKVRVRVVVGVH